MPERTDVRQSSSLVIEHEDGALVAAARALGPRIVAARAAIEEQRRLPLDIVAALREAGIISMAMPRAWGGPEAHPLVQFEALETLTRFDASVGWCAYIGSAGGFFSALLDQDVARAMYPRIDLVTGGAVRPTGQARLVEDGYRVSGRWPFGSGCQHSTWLASGCFVMEGEANRLDEAGRPEIRVCILPADACAVLDTWTTTGLRGSGSHDYTATDLFVPAEHTFNLLTSPIQRSGPLYAYRPLFLLNHAAIALGIARAAIEALTGLAAGKPTPQGTRVRDESYVQIAVARAEASVGAARSYIFSTVEDLWATLCAGHEPSVEQRARFRLAITHAHTAGVEAVDQMYHAGGGSSLYSGNPLDRCLRDIHTINQHAQISPKTYESAGRLLLGLSAGVPFF